MTKSNILSGNKRWQGMLLDLVYTQLLILHLVCLKTQLWQPLSYVYVTKAKLITDKYGNLCRL